jgi:chemotaxis protein methyltransferase CheR
MAGGRRSETAKPENLLIRGEALTMPTLDASLVTMDVREFKTFRELIHRKTGIWLRDGKQAMLAGRLSKRLRHHGMTNFAAYAAYVDTVQDGGKELAEIINCVTTNKTSFFREIHHFDFLTKKLVPDLVAGAALGRARNIRIWSAACSTGEEPYSIAIAVLDALKAAHVSGSLPPVPGISPPPPGGWQVEVVASDIDTVVLATASQGIYDQDSLADVPHALQTKYFLRGKGNMAGQVRVKKEVAQLVKFQRINLMDSTWPLEGKFDVIFFRNALIYFNRETQEVFLRKMLGYLKARGYLILGHSEHVPWLNDSVESLNNTIHQLRAQKRPAYTGPERRRRSRQ